MRRLTKTIYVKLIKKFGYEYNPILSWEIRGCCLRWSNIQGCLLISPVLGTVFGGGQLLHYFYPDVVLWMSFFKGKICKLSWIIIVIIKKNLIRADIFLILGTYQDCELKMSPDPYHLSLKLGFVRRVPAFCCQQLCGMLCCWFFFSLISYCFLYSGTCCFFSFY